MKSFFKKSLFLLVIVLVSFSLFACKKADVQEEVINVEAPSVNLTFNVVSSLLKDGQKADTNVYVPGEKVELSSFISGFKTQAGNMLLVVDYVVYDSNNKTVSDLTKYGAIKANNALTDTQPRYYDAKYSFDTYYLQEGDYTIGVIVSDKISKKILIQDNKFKITFPKQLTIFGPYLLDKENKVRSNDYKYAPGEPINLFLRVTGLTNTFFRGRYLVDFKTDMLIVDANEKIVSKYYDALNINQSFDKELNYAERRFTINTTNYKPGTYTIMFRVNDTQANQILYSTKEITIQ